MGYNVDFTRRNTNVKPKTAQQLAKDNLIVRHYAGSRAYGTALPTSDTDFRGIFVGDPVNIRTPFFRVDEVKVQGEEDTVMYELANFMKLAVDCNPNVVETLWVDMSDVTFQHPAYMLMREAAPKLLSSRIAFTTSGYALAQLKRIRGHNKWINNPQEKEPPRQTDFLTLVHNFTTLRMFKFNALEYREGHSFVPYGGAGNGTIFGVYEKPGAQLFSDDWTLNVAEYEGNTHELGTPLFLVKFNKDVYNAAKEKWAQYWTWKRERNEVRSELEEQYGYDTKHAMHLVRLLRMGVEALTEGKLYVRRPDAEELLAIRAGAWTYEQVVEYAEMMDHKVREELLPKTFLPKKPNVNLAAQLTLEVQDAVWTTMKKNSKQ